MADFTGFYFNNIHSSTYNIYRVSNGSRFEEGLIPDFEDFSTSVIGGDGNLYQGRRFKPIPFKINIAYDYLTEENLRKLRNWLAPGELKPLRLDERPYKTYFVKLSSRPILNYICFLEKDDDGNELRIYKGEGELNFTAYDPFGYCIDESYEMKIDGGLHYTGKTNWQVVNSYTPDRDVNAAAVEWNGSAQLSDRKDFKDKQYNIPIWSEEDSSYYINLYNPGDFETDFLLYLQLNQGIDKFTSSTPIILTFERYELKSQYDYSSVISDEFYEWKTIENSTFKIDLKSLYQYNTLLLNTKNHSLAVAPSVSGRAKPDLRYDTIKSAEWKKIPIGKTRLKISLPQSFTGQNCKVMVKYNYKYY